MLNDAVYDTAHLHGSTVQSVVLLGSRGPHPANEPRLLSFSFLSPLGIHPPLHLAFNLLATSSLPIATLQVRGLHYQFAMS